MSSEDVDRAMDRAEADKGRAGHRHVVACGQAVADRYFLAQEVKRLRTLVADAFSEGVGQGTDYARGAIDTITSPYGETPAHPLDSDDRSAAGDGGWFTVVSRRTEAPCAEFQPPPGGGYVCQRCLHEWTEHRR